MMIALFGFLFAMWVLILIGGGIIVYVLGPFSLMDSSFPWFVSSGIKAAFAFCLVIIWIFILLKVKNWIFKKELNF
jgi:hypothetical protein